MKAFTSESFKNITGYEAVRTAAKDHEKYSSDLQGDRDVRDYRQLPLEVDPPQHTDYRHAVQSVFLRPKLESLKPEFEAIAKNLLQELIQKQKSFDVYQDFSLPFVISCLSVIYGRPQDKDEWISWGPDVWTAKGPQRDGETLHNYLERVFDESAGSEDIWTLLKSLRPAGTALTQEEFKGYAGVLLAGGRDTVIKLISGLFWHLLNAPADALRIEQTPELERALINELLRFLSPLPAIERVEKANFDSENPMYYRLHFASANFDPTEWEEPEKIDLDRGRKPHMAFGYGPHTCLGMNLAEYEARAFLKEFIQMRDNFKLESYELTFSEVEGIRYLDNLTNLRVGF
jgi:cytochrome P450